MTDPSSVTKSDGPTAPAITASIGPSLLFAAVDVTSLSLGAWDEDDEHIVYCVPKGEAPTRPDPLDPHAVPVTREGTGADLAAAIADNNTLTMVIDGLRLVQPLPAMARSLLTLIDGTKTVADIEAVFASRGMAADVFPPRLARNLHRAGAAEPPVSSGAALAPDRPRARGTA